MVAAGPCYYDAMTDNSSSYARSQLLRDGYVIVRNVIPTADLEGLRDVFERLVDRQRQIWVDARQPGDPPGGSWESSAQPRLGSYDGLVHSAADAPSIELILGRPLEESRQVMQAELAPTQFMLMCSPVADHGPAAWHRDIHPIDQAPVVGLQQDLLANGPGYLQWNLALHDDDVLWVVPGSHGRPNSAEESRCLAEDPRKPLPQALQVELGAGDAVMYSNLILHWGSNYSPVRRRTVHFGFRAFGGDLLPYVLGLHRQGDAAPHLSPWAQAAWQQHRELYDAECDMIEAALRAVIQGDVQSFGAALARLHPGTQQREVALILLSKLAHKLCFEQHSERPGYGGDFTQERQLAPRFSAKDLAKLWQRMVWVDDRLRAPGGHDYVPGYQSGEMSYRFESMPEDLTVGRFTESWA